MKKIIIIFTLLILYPNLLYAWNNYGHSIIAQIAYDYMTPAARNAANDLIDRLSDQYPQTSTFQTAATWADFLRHDNVNAFNSWHFINYRYNPEQSNPGYTASENIVWATNQSIAVLQSQHATEFERALFFRFLIHFVGDAHQPLHCISLYNKSFLHGDNGGNLYIIDGEPENNLHAFWDNGLGLFNSNPCHEKLLKSSQISCLSQFIESKYPPSYFGNKTQDLNPQDWTIESFNLAKLFVYTIPENSVPAPTYIAQGQIIVEQQLALAGYRLANLLNSLLA